MYETPSLTSPRSVVQRAKKLFYLLKYFYEICKDEVIAAFHANPDILDAYRQLNKYKGSKSQIYLGSDNKQIDARVLKTMFDLGLDINSVDIKGNTSLISLLTHGDIFFIELQAQQSAFGITNI